MVVDFLAGFGGADADGPEDVHEGGELFVDFDAPDGGGGVDLDFFAVFAHVLVPFFFGAAALAVTCCHLSLLLAGVQHTLGVE